MSILYVPLFDFNLPLLLHYCIYTILKKLSLFMVILLSKTSFTASVVGLTLVYILVKKYIPKRLKTENCNMLERWRSSRVHTAPQDLEKSIGINGLQQHDCTVDEQGKSSMQMAINSGNEPRTHASLHRRALQDCTLAAATYPTALQFRTTLSTL